MCDDQATFTQNLNEISITELEPKIPAQTEKNDLVFEPPSGKERISLGLVVCHCFIVVLFPLYLHQNPFGEPLTTDSALQLLQLSVIRRNSLVAVARRAAKGTRV